MAIEYRTEPEYFEYLDGKVYPKVSPRRTHAVVQATMIAMLLGTARERGTLASEWDFRLGAVDGTKTKFIPDIAFVYRERLDALERNDPEEPPLAPDIAIEIRSPSNRQNFIAAKIERYLACGATLVLDVDPASRSVTAHAAGGVRRYENGERFSHLAVPWMTFDVADAFADLERLT
jgi:Uma2 family endonuclease